MLISLALENFKSITKAHYSFSEQVLIQGDNGTGKSSIAEAIVYALFGTTLTGSNRTESYIRLGAKSMGVTLEFKGVDGQKHVVSRSRGRSKQLALTLDGKNVTQEAVEELMGDRHQFLAAFWPTYVLGMKEADAREFFAKLLPALPPGEVLTALDEPFRSVLAGKNLAAPQKLAVDIRAEIRNLEMEITRMEGAIEELQQVLQEAVPPEEIELPALKEEAARISDFLNRGLQAERQKAALEKELAALGGQYHALKREYASLSPAWQPGDTCPTCGQVISEAVIARVSQAVMEKKQSLKAEMYSVVARGKDLRAQLNAFSQVDSAGQELIARQKAVLEALTEAEKKNAYRESLLKKQADARKKVAAYQEAIANDRESINHLHVELQALIQYNAKRAEMLSKTITSYFNKAGLTLFEIVKSTGEVKPVFRLEYDGRPAAVLSTSERIRLGLEVAGAVKALTGMEWPTFIDDGESITSFMPPPGQVFVARVSEGMPLTVTALEQKEKRIVA